MADYTKSLVCHLQNFADAYILLLSKILMVCQSHGSMDKITDESWVWHICWWWF